MSKYGISDFEKQVEELPSSELAPLLSNDLAKIPWQRERDEFMPKPFSKQKFVYKSDFLSDRIIEQQELVQDFTENLLSKIKKTSAIYDATLNRLDDYLDDKYLIPSIGLGSLAGIISWRSNKTAPLPLKAIYSLSGVFVSTLITHADFRNNLKHKIASNLPEDVVNNYKVIDGKFGSFFADAWDKGEDLFIRIKDEIQKISNKYNK